MSEEWSEEAKAHWSRYLAATHAMQAGVGFYHPHGEGEQSPKHLRVGVNSAMVQNGALVKLLVEKGVFTNEEWLKELADAMEREVESYRSNIKARHGIDATLG